MDWMDEIASESALNQANAWLCERGLGYSAHGDVWDASMRWEETRPQPQAHLRVAAYRYGPIHRFHQGDETIEDWSALDALVLKATAPVPTAIGCQNSHP